MPWLELCGGFRPRLGEPSLWSGLCPQLSVLQNPTWAGSTFSGQCPAWTVGFTMGQVKGGGAAFT